MSGILPLSGRLLSLPPDYASLHIFKYKSDILPLVQPADSGVAFSDKDAIPERAGFSLSCNGSFMLDLSRLF